MLVHLGGAPVSPAVKRVNFLDTRNPMTLKERWAGNKGNLKLQQHLLFRKLIGKRFYHTNVKTSYFIKFNQTFSGWCQLQTEPINWIYSIFLWPWQFWPSLWKQFWPWPWQFGPWPWISVDANMLVRAHSLTLAGSRLHKSDIQKFTHVPTLAMEKNIHSYSHISRRKGWCSTRHQSSDNVAPLAPEFW